MNPLDTATTEELTNELKRRAEHGVIIIAGYDPSKRDGYGIHTWGSQMWTIGACRFVETESLKDLGGEAEIDNAMEP